MICSRCSSDRTSPINIEMTVYECMDCKNRFHKNGFDVNSVLFQGSIHGTWPTLKATLDMAKNEGTYEPHE